MGSEMCIRDSTTAEVRKLSGGKQEPRISEMSISERLYLAGPGTQIASVSPEPTSRPAQSDPEEEAWQATKSANTAAAYNLSLIHISEPTRPY